MKAKGAKEPMGSLTRRARASAGAEFAASVNCCHVNHAARASPARNVSDSNARLGYVGYILRVNSNSKMAGDGDRRELEITFAIGLPILPGKKQLERSS